MTEADILYRAFGELIKSVGKDGGISKILDASAKAPTPAKLTVYHHVCKVENDWLDQIERGLVFIGRAIEEDRQFIRSEGEVQPIEKVKKISRESVQYLSRHSDLITRKQKDDIVPDKLYTVERDSDYAVYENKFLYLLLCRIREFVGTRYEAINSAYKKYRGEYEVQKHVITSMRRLDFGIKITDEQDDIVSAPADKDCVGALERMDRILESVSFYLHTPLMTEVSHSDKIGGNITKTNVLLMNKNFNEALNLYEFLLSYEGEGYVIEDAVETPDPVPYEDMRELSVPPILLAFLVYEHGLRLEEYLKNEYEKEEERLREEALNELTRRLQEIKRKIESSGVGFEEYISVLEDKIKELEKNLPVMENLRAENSELKSYNLRLENERKVLLGDIEELKAETISLMNEMRLAEERHINEISELKAAFEDEKQQMKQAHAEEIEKISLAAEEKLSAVKASHAEELSRLKETHLSEIEAVGSSYKEKIKNLEEERKRESERIKREFAAKFSEEDARLKASEGESAKRGEELIKVREELRDSGREREVLEARLLALRREYGLLTSADDFTTEEGFNALEHEFEVLGKLVRDEWNDVKKILKKEFHSSILESMHKKKPRKSKEYEDLKQKVNSRKERERLSKEITSEKEEKADTGTAAKDAENSEVSDSDENV